MTLATQYELTCLAVLGMGFAAGWVAQCERVRLARLDRLAVAAWADRMRRERDRAVDHADVCQAEMTRMTDEIIATRQDA